MGTLREGAKLPDIMPSLSLLDLILFGVYLVVVLGVGLLASRREEKADDYFLAGRSLPWWLIGASLLASNISTEQFVGMAGSGVRVGMAIASYEWMSALTLVIVARWFMPRYLAGRIGTMPEFLERRFSSPARSWLAFYMLVAYVLVALATVLYSGSLALQTLFGLPIPWGLLLLSVFGGAYTIYGGLRAVVWTDFVQAAFLVLGGAIALFLSLDAVGGWGELVHRAPDKFHTVLPLDNPDLPWFAVFFGGLWIANLFYWGCNQFITQRALAARNLRQARYGVILAAWFKLLMPFLIVVPGIAALELFPEELAGHADSAFPVLVKHLLPAGLRGVMLAALIGAVMSSLDSMLNSAATIFTLDIYRRHLRPDADEARLIRVGRWSTLVFLGIATAWAPMLGRFQGVFHYIQEFWGLVTPGVTVVFLAGMFWRRASALGATLALALTLPVTIGIKLAFPGMAFLNQMWLAALLLAMILVLTSSRPIPSPSPVSVPPTALPVRRDRFFDVLCVALVLATVALYALFY